MNMVSINWTDMHICECECVFMYVDFVFQLYICISGNEAMVGCCQLGVVLVVVVIECYASVVAVFVDVVVVFICFPRVITARINCYMSSEAKIGIRMDFSERASGGEYNTGSHMCLYYIWHTNSCSGSIDLIAKSMSPFY